MGKQPLLTVGFVGASGSARHHLAGCVHSGLVGRAVLVDADDEARAGLRRRYGLIKADHAQLEPLLADPEVSLVDICGEVAGRFEAARLALGAGKHVILASPPTSSVAELDELARRGEEAGVLLLCALHPLHVPARLKLDELLSRQELPPPVLTTALSVLPAEEPAVDLLGAAYEAIVGVQHVLQPAEVVVGAVAQETALAALLRLPGEVPAQLSLRRAAEGELPWGEQRLFTAEGMILLRDNPEDETPLIIAHGGDFFPARVKTPPDVYEYAAVHCMEHLLACVVAGTAEPEVLAEARAALATWEAVREAAAGGSPVPVTSPASSATA
ncbi:Gfo/Idh/MocA family oxidoreductase [bacterium]|nr:Gfo/Idh/MocA family oxidoreductase [bacterium]